MVITTDIFGIEEYVTQSGILGEYRTSSEIRIRFVIENAGVSSQFTIYGKIKGQTAWNSITTLTANEIKDVTVAEFDFIMIVCDVYSSTSNTVHFLASGIAILNNTFSSMSIERISGPAQIAASESVSALYTGAPPTGTVTNSYNIITYGTKVKDSL